MKRILQGLLGAAGMMAVATPAMAQGLSVNAAITNNYVWRGITQSDENFAVQGGADYDFGNGLAIGTWASTVDFNDGETSFELDLYGSYSGMFNDMFGYTVGAIGYLYPDSPSGSNLDFFEIYGGLSAMLGPATLSGRLYFSPDIADQTSLYWTGGIAVPFGGFFTASANIGYYDFENGFDYVDYNVGLAATYEFVTASLTYTGTDIDGADEYLVGLISVKFPIP
jgi:uncharacterized protein (TIGR02001 family)